MLTKIWVRGRYEYLRYHVHDIISRHIQHQSQNGILSNVMKLTHERIGNVMVIVVSDIPPSNGGGSDTWIVRRSRGSNRRIGRSGGCDGCGYRYTSRMYRNVGSPQPQSYSIVGVKLEYRIIIIGQPPIQISRLVDPIYPHTKHGDVVQCITMCLQPCSDEFNHDDDDRPKSDTRW